MTAVQETYDYLPEHLRANIPPLYATDGAADPPAHIKLFTPDSSWTWYVIEASALMKNGQHRPINGAGHIVFAGDSAEVVDVVCFGLVVGLETELGYFSLSEIRRARGPLGLPVERDLFFQPAPLSEVRARHVRTP
jgi:hypothetical protein